MLMKLFKGLKKSKHFKKEKALSDFDYDTIKEGLMYSMASWERLYANINSVKYLLESDITGSIVECGVWRGGSMLTMLRTLMQSPSTEREIFLYDTFSGMSRPTKEDGAFAITKFEKLQTGIDRSDWCCAEISEVKSVINRSSYPKDLINFIEGKIEATIPQRKVPEQIALLRIDMDWHEPTLHALKYLYPKLVKGGVLILDDYGHWEGCKAAVDEYFSTNNIRLLMNRIDYTGRIAVKV
jgi:O-methyltransferase